MNRLSGKWMVVVSLLFGTFTMILNNSMLNPAIPLFMEVFEVDAVAAGWIITIFMVSMGMTMPVTGYLGDKFGKKKVYLMGLSLFVLGSLLGSFSWTLEVLIFFRAIQGIAGGIMMPLSMALIFEAFPRKERGMATGVWGVAAMMAPTIGPTLGGVIVEMATWHFLFLVNVPFGLLALVVATMYLKEVPTNPGIRFDRWGFLFVTLGVGAILFALGNTSSLEHLQDPLNVTLILLGLVSIYFFVRVEKRAEFPLLDLSILRIKAYSLSIWVTGVTSVGLFAGIFLIPLLIQQVYGLSAIITGLVFLPAALLSGIFMSIGGRILDRRGATGIVTSGVLILGGGTIALSFMSMETALFWIFFWMAVRGVGMGFSSIPATTAGMNAIPEKVVSRGSAMNNVFRQMSNALGIVFVSIYFEVRRSQLFAENGFSIEEASLQAINEGFLIIGILTLLTVPAAFMLGKKSKEAEMEIEKEEERKKA
ncbi:MDR family MFS transporter [Thalassobacillus sp. C254]|uniref:MDR family MFS transporter n=1 Tax=Thalassobacillus sp. C254 TaxID=1225341 RepID=UPI0006CF8C79|nr:MDR family MFS transporter [Thalassobacillus sp. C254]